MGTVLSRRSVVWLLPCLAIAGLGCGDARAEFHIVHPIHDSLIHPVPPIALVTVGTSARNGTPVLPRLRRYADRLSHTRDVLQLGVAEGPEPLTFGSIRDAATDRLGRIMVLDDQALQLRVFDHAGRALQTFGGPGDGPGEYRYPRTLSVGPSGRAAVFDGRGVVHLYSLDSDSVRFIKTVDLRMSIDYGCLLGDTLVVEGRQPGSDNILHVFARDGTAVRSFGVLYATDNPRVREQISDSVLECVERSQSIIVAPVFLPEVRSYALSGELRWWTQIEGLRMIDFRENDQGFTSLGVPTAGYHGTIQLSATPSGVVVQQIAFVTKEARRRGELAGVETLLLDAGTGAALYVSSAVTRLRWAGDREVLYYVTDPFPRLVMAALDESGPLFPGR